MSRRTILSFIDGLSLSDRRVFLHKIRARYEDGATLEEFRAELKCGYYTVRALLETAGATIRRSGNGLTDDQIADVLKRHKAGESVGELAESVGCSYYCIRGHLVAAGVKLSRQQVTDNQAAEMVRRYKARETIRELVASTGYSYGTIHRYLVAAGVEIRPRGPR